MSNLILGVDHRSRAEALRTTSNLLQASLIMRKPHHTVNALHILMTLYRAYDDLSDTVCQGSVPFLENEREDPLKVVPSERSLPSTLACVYYLFLTRIALPPPPPTNPMFPAMRKERKLTKDAEDHMDTTLLLFVNLVATHQLASKTLSRSFALPVRRRIFDNMLIMHLKQKHYRTLERILGIIDIATRDVECSRLFIGWSISQGIWTTDSFAYMDTLSDLIEIRAAETDLLDMAVSGAWMMVLVWR